MKLDDQKALYAYVRMSQEVQQRALELAKKSTETAYRNILKKTRKKK